MASLGGTQLLIIDPQNDFCDIEGAALPVPGANADLDRVAALLDRFGSRLDAIHVTLDSHHPVDIAHPAWWCSPDGLAPAPFTVISEAEVVAGLWLARDPARQQQSLAYVQALAEQGRYQLIVWPEHCLIGSWGHNVHTGLQQALGRWARERQAGINYVRKGENPATEHYSAVQAEVPDQADPASWPNADLLARLRQARTILVAGEALSHCVASTVRDLVEFLGEGSADKLVLLEDCCSPVAGFEAHAREFVAAIQARGVRVMSSQDCFAAVAGDEAATVTLYRPTGPKEWALVEASGKRRWPARLPEQPIFYPVTNQQYAAEIAGDWNVKDSGVGFVTRFQVRKAFMDQYPVQCVGASYHTEWWVPAEQLEALNDQIVGTIEVIQTFRR